MEGVTACLVGRAERRRGIGLAQPERAAGRRSQSVQTPGRGGAERPVPRSTAGAGRSLRAAGSRTAMRRCLHAATRGDSACTAGAGAATATRSRHVAQ